MYELSQLVKHFRQGATTVRAVDGIDLIIPQGEFLVIEGTSGSGKTTLLQLLGGLDRPTSGSVLFDGHDLAAGSDRQLTDLRRTAFGFIFQQFNLIPTLSAVENVEAALAPAGLSSQSMRARAMSVLAEVGLEARLDHLPSELSGGEQQRVAIGRALVNTPRVILADEPTGNLDSVNGKAVLDLLANLSKRYDQTVVLVTHDREVSLRASRVLKMRDGKVIVTDQ